MRPRRALLLACALVSRGVLAQPVPATGVPVLGMTSYDQLATTLMEKYQIPGGAIAVARNRKLIFARGYGYANVAAQRPVQPDSAFRIASLSKPMTSAAIMLLVERGRLRLDQRVFDILAYEQPLPGQTVDPRLASITVRELLEHSGGWNRDTTFDPMFEPLSIAQAAGVPPPAGTQTIIRYMMGKPLQFDPGSDVNYSNYGYALLGRVISRITGDDYGAFVRHDVLNPSGAACMQIGHSFQSQPLPREVSYYDYPGAPLAQSITGDGQSVPWPDGGFDLEAMDAHGGWVGSTIDYLRFVLSVDGRTTPQILSASSVATMTERPSIPFWANSDYWYAKGWMIRPSGTDANWWHTGSLPGTTTLVVRAWNGFAWVAFFNSRPANSDGFAAELDDGMWTALSQATSFPTTDQFPNFSPCAVAGPRRHAARH